jgi:hypothetical protein|tara:strand:- start:279 stop:521 length:243 start_codon:yes stop_codon:yes gene_type:complete
MDKHYYIELSWNDIGIVSYFPGLELKDDEPEFDIIPTYGPIEEQEELGLTPVEARILTVSNGNECRKFQQSLIPIAMEVD